MSTAFPQIVKVQRPIIGGPMRMAFLVYDRDRKNEVVQSIPRHAMRALGNDPKGYFKAGRAERSKTWLIGERIADQSW